MVLVPDKNTQFALRGILARHSALGIRPISYDFRIHPGRDGGVRTAGPELLRGERARFHHALLVHDRAGCGASELASTLDLEAELEQRLETVWADRAKAIVIEPEVDAWIWGTESVLRECLAWPLRDTGIRDWLVSRQFQFDSHGKPRMPKEALEALIPVHGLPRSSSLYERVTGRISLRRCSDPAFLRLKQALVRWFESRVSSFA